MIIVDSADFNKSNVFNLDQLTKKGIRKGFYFIGRDLVKESRRLINKKPKSGLYYIVNEGLGGKILKHPRLHKASAPGEAPAVITGKLRKSVTFEVKNYNLLIFGSTIEYGESLENGAGRLRSRPFLYPAILNKNKNSTLFLRNNIIKSINNY